MACRDYDYRNYVLDHVLQVVIILRHIKKINMLVTHKGHILSLASLPLQLSYYGHSHPQSGWLNKRSCIRVMPRSFPQQHHPKARWSSENNDFNVSDSKSLSLVRCQQKKPERSLDQICMQDEEVGPSKSKNLIVGQRIISDNTQKKSHPPAPQCGMPKKTSSVPARLSSPSHTDSIQAWIGSCIRAISRPAVTCVSSGSTQAETDISRGWIQITSFCEKRMVWGTVSWPTAGITVLIRQNRFVAGKDASHQFSSPFLERHVTLQNWRSASNKKVNISQWTNCKRWRGLWISDSSCFHIFRHGQSSSSVLVIWGRYWAIPMKQKSVSVWAR